MSTLPDHASLTLDHALTSLPELAPPADAASPSAAPAPSQHTRSSTRARKPPTSFQTAMDAAAQPSSSISPPKRRGRPPKRPKLPKPSTPALSTTTARSHSATPIDVDAFAPLRKARAPRERDAKSKATTGRFALQRPKVEVEEDKRYLAEKHGIRMATGQAVLQSHISRVLLEKLEAAGIAQASGEAYGRLPNGFTANPQGWLEQHHCTIEGWPQGLPATAVGGWTNHQLYAVLVHLLSSPDTVRILRNDGKTGPAVPPVRPFKGKRKEYIKGADPIPSKRRKRTAPASDPGELSSSTTTAFTPDAPPPPPSLPPQQQHHHPDPSLVNLPPNFASSLSAALDLFGPAAADDASPSAGTSPAPFGVPAGDAHLAFPLASGFYPPPSQQGEARGE